LIHKKAAMFWSRTRSLPLSVGLISLLCAGAPQGQPLPFFEQPALITSAGQSPDVHLASVLAKKAGLTATLSVMATWKDLENQKTLILVLGASMKGLGEAGLDTIKENARVAALLEEAKKKSISVLCLHLGGEQRRGELTDGMIREYLPSARMAIVVKSGNADGLFTKICKEKEIALVEVERTLEAVEPLKAIFKK
jgi:hypothetical protein